MAAWIGCTPSVCWVVSSWSCRGRSGGTSWIGFHVEQFSQLIEPQSNDIVPVICKGWAHSLSPPCSPPAEAVAHSLPSAVQIWRCQSLRSSQHVHQSKQPIVSQAVFRQFSESRHTGFLEGRADWRCDARLLLARRWPAVMAALFQSELEACLAQWTVVQASSTGQQWAKLIFLTRELHCGMSSSWGGHYIRADFFLITDTVLCLLDPQKLHDSPKLQQQQQQPTKHWVSFPLRHCLRTACPHVINSWCPEWIEGNAASSEMLSQEWLTDLRRTTPNVSPSRLHLFVFYCFLSFCLFYISPLNTADSAAPARMSDFVVVYYRTFWTSLRPLKSWGGGGVGGSGGSKYSHVTYPSSSQISLSFLMKF